MEVIFAHREQPLPTVNHPDVDRLLRRMTAKRPDDRPADMNAVVAELDRVRPARPRRGVGWLVAAGVILALGAAAWTLRPPSPVVPGIAPETPPTPAVVRVVEPDAVTRPDRPLDRDMVRIAPGEFLMGSDDSRSPAAERPQHRVRITKAFLLGRHEVTRGEYVSVAGGAPGAAADLPVESVSWLDAVRFCNRFSERHGLAPYYDIKPEAVTIRGGVGYRLPTEAEWEFACRAGSATAWCCGDDPKLLDDYAWHAGNSGSAPHPVGRKRPNAWGLFDMHGNVPEWVWDRFDADYYKSSAVSDPLGSGRGVPRVHRGGSWNVSPAQTRSSARDGLGLHYGVTAGVGFRIARDAPAF
jgi:formylglycine-generating enzyme required for sulfatase activity